MMCLGVNSTQNLHHTLTRTQCPADAAEPSYCPTRQTLWLGLQPWTWLSYKTSPSHVSVVFEVLQELSPLTSFYVSPEGGRNHDCQLTDGEIEPRRDMGQEIGWQSRIWNLGLQTLRPGILSSQHCVGLGGGNSTHSNKGKSLAATTLPAHSHEVSLSILV